MKAARIPRFGPPSVIMSDDLPRPEPSTWQLRQGSSGIFPSRMSAGPRKGRRGGQLESSKRLDRKSRGSKRGTKYTEATNDKFTGAYAEYDLPSAGRMAQKPKALTFIEAASTPIVTVTAWQMLFDYARATAGETVLIHGAAGNVAAFAVQVAKRAGLHVIAIAGSANRDYVRSPSCGLSNRAIRGVVD